MKIKISCTVEVNPLEWSATYNIPIDWVERDVKDWIIYNIKTCALITERYLNLIKIRKKAEHSVSLPSLGENNPYEA